VDVVFFKQEHLVAVDQLPPMTLMALVYHYILSSIIKLDGNRTRTAMQLKVPIRTFRNRLREMSVLDYPIPPPRPGYSGHIHKKYVGPDVSRT
jgi:hypothetical protein